MCFEILDVLLSSSATDLPRGTEDECRADVNELSNGMAVCALGLLDLG